MAVPVTLKHVTKFSCSPDKQVSFTVLSASQLTSDVALEGHVKLVKYMELEGLTTEGALLLGVAIPSINNCLVAKSSFYKNYLGIQYQNKLIQWYYMVVTYHYTVKTMCHLYISVVCQ